MKRMFRCLALALSMMILVGMFPVMAEGNVAADEYIAEIVKDGAKLSTVNTPLVGTSKIMTGIDVSEYQGNIDWAKVKAAGVQFAILRICSHVPDTPNYTVDAKFAQNVSGAKAQGIHLGAYFFSYARNVSDVTNEANMVVNILKDYPATFDFPIVFDAETGDAADGFNIQSFAGDACATFRKILEENGYFVSIYANTDWFNNVIDANKIHGADLWQAHYMNAYAGYTPTQGPSIAGNRPAINNNNNQFVFMWQYTSKGSVNGIVGDVDMNVCYKDYPSIIVSGGFNGYPKPEVHTHSHTIPKSNDTQHWVECSCGDKANVVDHTFTARTDATHHFEGCDCGYVKAETKAEHAFTIATYNTAEHYKKCECGAIDELSRENHNYETVGYNEFSHYRICKCGSMRDSTVAPHILEIKFDDVNHWTECSGCEYTVDFNKHEMDGNHCKKCKYTLGEETEGGDDGELNTGDYETGFGPKPDGFETKFEIDSEFETYHPQIPDYDFDEFVTIVPGIDIFDPDNVEKETFDDKIEYEPSETLPEDDTSDGDDKTDDSETSGSTFIGVIVDAVVDIVKAVVYVALLPLKLIFGIFGI